MSWREIHAKKRKKSFVWRQIPFSSFEKYCLNKITALNQQKNILTVERRLLNPLFVECAFLENGYFNKELDRRKKYQSRYIEKRLVFNLMIDD